MRTSIFSRARTGRIRLAIVAALVSGTAYGGNSVRITSGAATFTIPAPYNAGARPMRWEMRIHNLKPAVGVPYVDYGFMAFGDVIIAGNVVAPGQFAWGTVGWGDAAPAPVMSNTTLGTDILVREQRDTNRVNCPGSPKGCYTVEVCDTTGGNCQSRVSNMTSLATSWPYGAIFKIAAGADVAFLRWYSSVVPMGLPVSIVGAMGDLGDWEFEGNLRDSSGNGHTFEGAAAEFVPTPVYPPSCNPGKQQSFRAGYRSALDGSSSRALDGGPTLAFSWRQVPGVSPTDVRWATSPYTAAPAIEGMVFGSYNFELTVTDGSGQSSSCVVHDGSVATDDHGVVILDNGPVTTMLGPAIQWGRNPWPWMDDRNKYVADLQIANIEQNYPAFWETPASGTISVKNGSATLTGVGTHFTKEVCQGPANPSEPNNVMIVAWWNGGANRRALFARSCIDDTHVELDPDYYTWILPPESGLTYSLDGIYWLNWQTSSNAQYPANYYDNVAAFYGLYYRTGIDTYLTYARKLADRFWTSPMMDKGMAMKMGLTSSVTYGGRHWSAMGLVLRALDGRPDMWQGLHNMWDLDIYQSGANVWQAWGTPGLWDQREQAYQGFRLAICALYDPDPAYGGNTGKCKPAIAASFTNIWKAVQDNFGDYSFPAWLGNKGTVIDASLYVTATRGSNLITLNGGTWTAADLAGGQFWMWPCRGTPGSATGCKRPNTNADGDSVSYSVTYVDPTRAILADPLGNPTTYQGSSGNKGWVALAGDVPALGWGGQPFMLGIIASALELEAEAMADRGYNPNLMSAFHQYAAGAVGYLVAHGIRPSTKGLYYIVGSVNCPVDAVPETFIWCTGGGSPGSPSPSRVLSAEAIRGMMFNWFNYTKAANVKDAIDMLYNAQWAKPGTCPQGSMLCVPDGYYMDGYDEGGAWVTGSPPGGKNPKWFGMPFGLNPEGSWPAMRLGGAEEQNLHNVYIGFHLQDVPGASGVRVMALAPNGQRSQTDCYSSPCAVPVDSRLGDYSFQLQYVAADGHVLAATQMPVLESRGPFQLWR